MKFSNCFFPTLREAPRDADNVSAKLMIRAGMIRKLAAGLYEWLPLGLRVLKNVEKIVREEMEAINGQEVWLPHIQPKELWEETSRWNVYGKELLRIKDRKGSEFCFAPTAEEVITDLIRRDVRSYRQLPVMCYQFGTKFRDEIRPRFGVMRAREFYMKDAYSFHADEADAENYYKKVYDAYCKIFTRCGLEFRPVEAEAGAIGGNFSHEFMVLAETGEEEIASCTSCGYAANTERAECAEGAIPSETQTASELPMEEIATPAVSSVEDVAKFTATSASSFIKAMFYMADGAPVIALVRGDTELNQFKLSRVLGTKNVQKMSEEQYVATAGCEVGFAGPIGLKQRSSNVKIIADHQLKFLKNAVAGGNQKDVHVKNVNCPRDYAPDEFADIHNAALGDNCARCSAQGKQSALRFSRGIEVGHTFKLGTKYSASMNAVYLDKEGKSIPFVMGCYGIGVSRVVAAAIEQRNDANGILWTKELAPFHIVLVPVKMDHALTNEWVQSIEKELTESGWQVLIDDRDERTGAKFKDADLIGVPVRITIGEKGLEKNQVEVKLRHQPEPVFIDRAKILEFLKEF